MGPEAIFKLLCKHKQLKGFSFYFMLHYFEKNNLFTNNQFDFVQSNLHEVSSPYWGVRGQIFRRLLLLRTLVGFRLPKPSNPYNKVGTGWNNEWITVTNAVLFKRTNSGYLLQKPEVNSQKKTAGFPQGSTLDPLLFLIFINISPSYIPGARTFCLLLIRLLLQ